jgi:hypothetical protein
MNYVYAQIYNHVSLRQESLTSALLKLLLHVLGLLCMSMYDSYVNKNPGADPFWGTSTELEGQNYQNPATSAVTVMEKKFALRPQPL